MLPATTTAAATIGTHNRPVSSRTILNRLRERGLRSRRPYVGPVLTVRHRQQRRQWCAAHLRWPARTWQQVLFSDESRFTLQKTDGRVRVFRRRGERYADPCVKEVDKFGRGSVMVWGGIRNDEKIGLIVIAGNLNAQRYRDEVLRTVVVPYINGRNDHVIFQQDNARPHVARDNLNYLNANNVDVMNWPSLSPDLNHIEHLWDELDRRVRRHHVQPTTLQQLTAAIHQEWQNIPGAVVRRLVNSMRRRCQAVCNAAGGHTRY